MVYALRIPIGGSAVDDAMSNARERLLTDV
jgi:hypothetical protein